MLPASRYGTWCLTQPYITPDVSIPDLTADSMPSRPADRVDGPQMVLVAGLHGTAVIEVDSQAGSVQRSFDIVRGQRVSGEQKVDVPVVDQPTHMAHAARVYDRWSADDRNPLAMATTIVKLPGNLADGHALRFLRGHAARHELESLLFRFALVREYANAGVSAHHLHAAPHLGHGNAPGRLALFDNDPAVHLLFQHVVPSALNADLRALVGRAVKPIRQGTVYVCCHQMTIFLRRGDGSMVGDQSKDLVQFLTRLRADLEQRIAGVMPALANRDVLDRKGTARLRDAIQNLRQNQTVNNMSADLYVLDGLAMVSGWRHVAKIPFPKVPLSLRTFTRGRQTRSATASVYCIACRAAWGIQKSSAASTS